MGHRHAVFAVASGIVLGPQPGPNEVLMNVSNSRVTSQGRSSACVASFIDRRSPGGERRVEHFCFGSWKSFDNIGNLGDFYVSPIDK